MTAPKFLLRAFVPLLAALAACLAGCGGSGPGPEDPAGGGPPSDLLWPGSDGTPGTFREECDHLPGPAVPGGDFVVTVTDSVRPARAPQPGNAAERLVFAQLYETPTRIACDGRVLPGLCTDWQSDADGAVWTLTLREGARLWDGTPVTASLLLGAWDRAGTRGRTPRRLGVLPLQAIALDERRLEVRPARPTHALPRLLAHPAWALAVVRSGWTWPVGSGPARLRASTPAPLPDLVCRPNPQHPQAPRWRRLVFETRPGADARDLVGVAADLLVVRDLAAARFYRELPGHTVLPLPWDRLHLLVCPPGPDSRRWRRAAAGLDPVTDLTTVDAVAWPQPSLPGGPHVPVAVGRTDPAPGQARLDSPLAAARLDSLTLVHAMDDPAAAELSGRLAALGEPGVRSVGLAASDVAAALHWRLPGAAVLTLSPFLVDPSLQRADLAGRFAWLAAAANSGGTDESLGAATRTEASAVVDLVARGLVVPLAVSRSWLVVRNRLAGLAVAGDGTLRLEGLGVPAAEAIP